MNIPNLPAAIKIFFIILSSFYSFGKILNIQITYKKYYLFLLFSLLMAPIIFWVQTTFPLYTILSLTLFIAPLCYLIFRQDFSKTLCVTILAIGCNYAFFLILLLIITPAITLLIFWNASDLLTDIVSLFFLGILQTLLLFLLFRTKRLCNGIPIIKSFDNNQNVFISALLLILSSCFRINKNIVNAPFHILLIAFIVSLSIIIWLWWQKSIQADYINRNNFQQIDILEDKLHQRDAELERLSAIIHKDNKLLAALELSTREILMDASSDKAQALLQELNRFSKERSEALQAYEATPTALPETGLFSVDTMIRYLHQRALKHKIDFQLSLNGEIAGITDTVNEQDLCTIIADLGENAIIATQDAEIKNIRLSIERKTDSYTLYFYDSGEPFASEVLESFGKKRCTTHAETGGSGIGLVTTCELAAKYQGEFYITEDNVPQSYTKCVVVKFKKGLP